MTLDLTEDETAALVTLLKRSVADDRYPFSPRVQTLQRILDRLEPPPARPAASPPPRIYAPPSRGRYRRREG
jgi:hypothetical protein